MFFHLDDSIIIIWNFQNERGQRRKRSCGSDISGGGIITFVAFATALLLLIVIIIGF